MSTPIAPSSSSSSPSPSPPSANVAHPCHVTIISGFLGAGKTTLISHWLSELNGIAAPVDVPSMESNAMVEEVEAGTNTTGTTVIAARENYSVVWLKNEYGEQAVDTLVASQNKSTIVKEILNGCICCTAVGKFSDALLELVNLHHPHRILIETSGSALPGTLVLELKEVIKKNPELRILLDGVITVIDCLNFQGYSDKSFTARLQTKCTDIIALNKWELANDRQMDYIMDEIFDLNPDTPKLRTNKGRLSLDVVFSLDGNMLGVEEEVPNGKWSTTVEHHGHHGEHCDSAYSADHFVEEVGVWEYRAASSSSSPPYLWTEEELNRALANLSKETVYRVKGAIDIQGRVSAGYMVPAASPSTLEPSSSTMGEDPPASSTYILNWAFGRFTLQQFASRLPSCLTMIGDHSTLGRQSAQIEALFRHHPDDIWRKIH